MNATRLPGYRRHIAVVPRPGAVLAMLEDDIHAMAVILRHDGITVRRVEAYPERMPWTTCPRATEKLIETFEGLPLAEITARREKKQNCTHLHDLAVLAANHALDPGPHEWTIAVSDPVDGLRRLDIEKDRRRIHSWTEKDGLLTEPRTIAGHSLLTLRDRIAALEGEDREAARLLQWAGLVAHGRTLPEERQSRAADLPPNCYTFQPQRALHAKRVGDRFDFSSGSRVPLAGFGDRMITLLDGSALA